MIELPRRSELAPYWTGYFDDVDRVVEENFWGSLGILRKTKLYADPYLAQLEAMGMCLDEGRERCVPFHDAIAWVCARIAEHVADGVIGEDDVLWPAKVFETDGEIGYVPLGHAIPDGARAISLLPPATFVDILARGYFPVGEPDRLHTNQSLAEHDLAHLAAFASQPRYMAALREAFRRAAAYAAREPRVRAALADFDSRYSLRLYYTVEVFTEIPVHHRRELAELLEHPLDRMPVHAELCESLLRRAARPTELYRYLGRLYGAYHRLVNALGGESRDMLNRRRKFQRGEQLGTFYDGVSQFASKFTRSSIWSLFLNANRALENKRSNHADFERSLVEIHAPILGAMIGTAQLAVEDWVLAAIEPVPDQSTKLYRYIHDSGLWTERDLLLSAFTSPDYDVVPTGID